MCNLRVARSRSMCNSVVAHKRARGRGPMTADDQIEREIFIAAPPELVWPLVAEPGFWATDDEAVRGTQVREGESLVARHSQHGEFPMRAEKVDPPRYLAYRWNSAFPGEELREDNSTLVEFTLAPE